MIKQIAEILFSPSRAWQELAAEADSPSNLLEPMILAVLPVVAWYYGTTQVGWSVASGDAVRLTVESANRIFPLFYLAMVSTLFVIGYFVHWMAQSYGCQSTTMRGITLAAYSATPLFIGGLTGFQPHLLADMLVAVVAVSWSVYLLYTGIPLLMGVSQERGFLFSSAVIAVCLVMLIAIMGGSVILWEMGAGPEFRD